MSSIELFYPVSGGGSGDNFNIDTTNNSQFTCFSVPLANNQAVSINGIVTMRTDDSLHFAQFDISGVFLNKAGVISEKNQSDTVVNRDNDQNYFRFVINGTNVDLVCSSGLNLLAHWSGNVSSVPV